MGRNGGNTAYALLQRPGGCEGRPNGVRVNLWALGRGGRAFAQAGTSGGRPGEAALLGWSKAKVKNQPAKWASTYPFGDPSAPVKGDGGGKLVLVQPGRRASLSIATRPRERGSAPG